MNDDVEYVELMEGFDMEEDDNEIVIYHYDISFACEKLDGESLMGAILRMKDALDRLAEGFDDTY